MKTILSLVFCAIFFSCSAPAEKSEPAQDTCTQYACPMHPDKTSTKPDACPECNMKMVPVDSLKSDSAVTRACCEQTQKDKS